MSKHFPLVSIVILNWNGAEDTARCIDSVKKLIYPSFEIIVIDNGSIDGSVNILKKVKNIKFYELPKNTGFTGGHIEGLNHAKGEYIALLNNDLVVDPNWLTMLVDCSMRQSADIVGGRSYEWDELQEPYNTSNNFSSYQTVSPFTGHTRMLKQGHKETEANNLSGSNLLVSMELIKNVGYLDSSFFAYYEETDFIARAKRAGYKAYYCPDAHVWHKSGASTRGNPFFYYFQMHRNRFRFAIKNYDSPYLKRFFSQYTKEFVGALKQNIRSKNDHDGAMVKAYLVNLYALPSLFIKRRHVIKSGPSYNNMLLSHTEGFDDVTVIVPCYNYENYVTETLDSIEAQTLQPYAVIIINDGSSDQSAQTIQDWIISHSDSSIKYSFIDKPNEGVIKTKNLALNLVKTNWMMFLDADDLIDPDYIYKCVSKARNEESDVVYTDMKMFGSLNKVQKTAKYNAQLLKSVNFIHNSALMRTDVFKKSGGYKEKMSIGFEDWELYLTLSELTNKFSYIDEPLLKYRRHENASRDISAQNKMSTVIKFLEELHPDLYNMRFYWWLESFRAKQAAREIIAYPIRLMRHTKSHIIKGAERTPQKRLSRMVLSAQKKLHKGDLNND